MRPSFRRQLLQWFLALLLVSNPLLTAFLPLVPAPVSAAPQQPVGALPLAEQPSSGADVTITDSAFVPQVFTVTVGSAVTWVNGGSMTHRVQSGTPPVVTQTPTATATNTPVPDTPTATNTPVPDAPTATNTPVPDLPTATNTPVPATNTPTATNTPSPTASPTPGTSRNSLYLPLVLSQSGTSAPRSGPAWGSGVLNPGESFSHTFDTVGSYDYYDPLHPELRGQVVVIAPQATNQEPVVSITSPAEGAVLGVGEVQVSGTVTDDGTVVSVLVNDVAATINGNTFSATISLGSGNQVIEVVAEDDLGALGLASRVVSLDGDGPEITINAPDDAQSVYTLQPTIAISYSDFNGTIDTTSLLASLVNQNGTTTDITSDLTVSASGAQGTLSGALAEDTVYTLTVSLADELGNGSSTNVAFYIPPDADNITPPDEPENAGWISGYIYDSSTCNEHQTTCQGVAGVEVTLSLVDTAALQQVRDARQRQIEREWLTRGKAPAPMDASVAETFSRPLLGTVVTGPDGFFAFPVAQNGTYWLRSEKEGYTYAQRDAQVVLERSTATNAIYVTPLDSALTSCDESGCMHNSSDGSMQLEIPAGAIPSGDTREVSATNFEQVEYLPSGDLPPGTEETYAFNLGGDSEMTFDQPVTVRQKNERGFAPGTSIPLGYWNQITQQWEHAGTGVVNATGEWIEMQVTHFSNYDCNDPVTDGSPGDDTNDEDDEDEPCDCEDKSCETGCTIDLSTGTVGEDVTLPSVSVLGEEVRPQLLYNTNRAYPTKAIDVKLTLDPEEGVVFSDTIGFELYIEGEKTDNFVFSADIESGEVGRFRYLWDGRDAQGNLLSPGSYEYAAKFTIGYRAQYCYALNGIFGNPPDCENGATGRFTTATNEVWHRGSVKLDTRIDTPFGDGWVVADLQQLYISADGDILIRDGDNLDEFLDLGRVQSTVQRYPQRQAPVLAPQRAATTSHSDNQVVEVSAGANPSFEPGVTVESELDDAEQTANLNSPPWTNIANYPTSIMDNTAAEFDGLIYSVGGRDAAGNRFKSAHAYDPDSNSWSQIADMNNVHQKPAAAFIDGLLYVAGGWDAGVVPTTTLEIYNPATDSWTFGAPMPVGSSAAPGVALGGKFYVVGGCSDSECVGSTDVFRYDPALDTWTTLASYPELIAWQSCGAIGARIYCAGGTTSIPGGTDDTESNSTYVYNPATDVWTQLAEMPQSQWGAYFTVANSRLYISSGVANSNISSQGFYYDPLTDSWTQFESANYGRYRGASACGFYKLGGSSGNLNARSNSELYPDLGECGTEVEIYSRTETDYSTLTYDSDTNTYSRTYLDGTQVHFNPDGTHDYTLDPTGNKTVYTYHPDGTVATMGIIAAGATSAAWTWQFGYTGGKLTQITDAAGRVTSFAINQHNHLTQVTFPDGSERQFVYDARGLLTNQSDQSGDVTSYDYDSYGRLHKHTGPQRAVYDPISTQTVLTQTIRTFTPSDTAYELLNNSPLGDPDNPAPPVITSDELIDGVRYGRGTRTGQTNKWGSWLNMTDGEGRSTSYERDDSNNITRKTLPDGDCVEYSYDDNGKQLTEDRMGTDQCALVRAARDPSQIQNWSYTYEARFNQIKSETDPLSNTTTYFYDYEEAVGEAGKLIRIEYPPITDTTGTVVTPTVSYTYNQWGLLDTQTDRRGTVTKYVYTEGTSDEASDGADPLFAEGVTPVPGLLTQMVEDYGDNSHLNLTTTFKNFDAQGNAQTMLDPRGNPTSYTFDAMGRKLSQEDALSRVSKYTYDGRGYVIEMIQDYTPDGTTGRNVVTTYTYDVDDRNLSQQTAADGLLLQTVNVYDINGQLATQTDGNGNTTIYSYDEADQLIAEIDPLSHTTVYSYTRRGQLSTVTDPAGSIRRYQYDAFDRQIAEIVADGDLNLTTGYTYDQNNNLTSVTAPDGTVTCYSYDALNRRTSDTQDCGALSLRWAELVEGSKGGGLNLTTVYTYNAVGDLIATENERGIVMLNSYDALGRIISTRQDANGLNLTTTYDYDSASNLISTTDERGVVTTFSYDALNRQTTVTQDANGLNLTTTFGYDRLDNQSSITDPKGIVTLTEYNAFGQPIRQVEDLATLRRPSALEAETTYTYDNNLNLIAITDHNGNSTQYSYNARNEDTQTLYADGTTVDLTYNPDRTLAERTDQANDSVTFAYDEAKRLLSKTFPDGSTQSLAYDTASRQTRASQTMSGHTTHNTFAYNNLSNVISSTQTVDGSSWNAQYAYDYTAGESTITYPSGTAVVHKLDSLNRLGQVEQDSATVATYSYNDTAGTVSLAYANGVTSLVETDALRRVTRLNSALGANSPFADYRYGYDDAGNRTSMQRAHKPNQPADVYQYDGLYQLTQVWYGADSTDPDTITTQDVRKNYQLDTLGNRLSLQNNGTTETYSPNDGQRLTNPMNRYEQVDSAPFGYDAKGNLLTDDGNSYTYDYDNRQISMTGSASSAEYIYDALGRRVAKVVDGVTTYYVYNGGYQVVEERDGSDALVARYIYGQGIDESLMMERGGGTYYYHRDAQTSITEITHDAGGLVERYEYDIYGEPHIFDSDGRPLTTSISGNPYLYTGRRYDPESSNYYFRARIYAPEVGRFSQMDPLGYVDGMNLYANYFVVNKTDPSGEVALCGTILISVGAWELGKWALVAVVAGFATYVATDKAIDTYQEYTESKTCGNGECVEAGIRTKTKTRKRTKKVRQGCECKGSVQGTAEEVEGCPKSVFGLSNKKCGNGGRGEAIKNAKLTAPETCRKYYGHHFYCQDLGK
ncbi:MAG: kelch repeat-containing protein [Ardenticatenaceae bacterium]